MDSAKLEEILKIWAQSPVAISDIGKTRNDCIKVLNEMVIELKKRKIH